MIIKAKIQIKPKYNWYYEIDKIKITLLISFMQKLKSWIRLKILEQKPKIWRLVKKR